ncbi:MAG: transglycosylase SLT domain-containing protein [Myxococcota bacterium]
MQSSLWLLPLLLQSDVDSLLLRDDHVDVRAALVQGDGARARELLDEDAGRARREVPGLVGSAKERSGQKELACQLYQEELKSSSTTREAAALRAARCLLEAGQRDAAKLALTTLREGKTLARDPRVADEAASMWLALGDKTSAVRALQASAILDHATPRDTLRREALARSLLILVEHGDDEDRKRALLRLYLEFGETASAKSALSRPEAKELAEHRDRDLALRRAEALSERHDNEGVFATLAPHQPSATLVNDEACAIRLLSGKAARKLRRYRDARASLDAAATRCRGDVQRRARYLAAQVAYYQGSRQALSLLAQYAQAYPEDIYTDDVLFWRGELLERAGKEEEAIATYGDVVTRFPGGDLREQARFHQAFLLARRGASAAARAVLEEAAGTEGNTAAAVAVADRAQYWRARLLLLPDPHSLTVNDDVAERNAGLQALIAFAQARPASYYGHLARLLVIDRAEAAGSTVSEARHAMGAAPGARRRALTAGGAMPTGTLAADPRFEAAVTLWRAGYDEEARLLLDGIDYSALDDDGKLALPQLYTHTGDLGRAHQVMRFTGRALLPGAPSGTSLLPWHLGFPRAHQEAITEAASAVTKVPATLLMGLCREESAFDADVVSWAGAIGLCQLMPPTAKEEAQLLKLASPSPEALRDPRLNARLGANHLSRRMKLLGHPLLAIAAYNAGPGNVAKWRKDDAPKPIDAFVESIPVEQTRDYVKKVTGSWVVYEALDGDVENVRFPLLLP